MITFDAKTHTYKLDGVVVPSVTQILGLANLYEFIDKKLLKRAADFGTAVHKATELYDEGRLNESNLDVALVPYLNGWKKFLNDTKFHVDLAEKLVYSHHGYAGTFDRMGVLDSKNTLLDIKTSTVVPKTTALQLAAYQGAWEEMGGNPVDQLMCVQLKPDSYSIKVYNNPKDYFTFLTFLSVYKWSQS